MSAQNAKDRPKRSRTNYPGVYATPHSTRKHGVALDQYFEITYRLDGSKKWEGLGWASKGMKASKASLALAELKENQRTGKGPRTLAEKRALAKAGADASKAEAERLERDALTFEQFWNERYWPLQEHKAKGSRVAEEVFFRLWIAPAIGSKPLVEITPFDLERVKSGMLRAGKAPSTAKYCLAVISQVWTLARRDGFVASDSPTRQVKLPKIDNRRLRHLSPQEAQDLLSALRTRSIQTHDFAVLGLYAGLRFGEAASLDWHDTDMEQGILTIRDPKARVNRRGYISSPIREMLERRKSGSGGHGLVFKTQRGERVDHISNIFRSVADELFNHNVTDRRQKVTFHTLRHTFASWLVANGQDLYHVKELMGHADLKMTQRYSHLSPNNLKVAALSIEGNGWNGQGEERAHAKAK